MRAMFCLGTLRRRVAGCDGSGERWTKGNVRAATNATVLATGVEPRRHGFDVRWSTGAGNNGRTGYHGTIIAQRQDCAEKDDIDERRKEVESWWISAASSSGNRLRNLT